MKSGRGRSGFTIIETLIFLAVTTALLISGMLLINGQERKTRFTQSLNDIREQIDGLINNVATGYYFNNENFSCSTFLNGQPNYPLLVGQRGTNERCIYLGRAIQFRVGGVDQNISIFTIGGRQFKSGSVTVPSASLADAYPRAIHHTSAIENKQLGAGIIPKAMKYNGTSSTSILAIITDFAGLDGSGNLTSSSRSAQLYGISGATLNPATSQGVAIGLMTSPTLGIPAPNFVRANDVTICFESTGTDQYGIITVGGDNRQLTTNVKIVSKSTSPAECS